MRIAVIHHSEDTLNDYGAYVASLLEAVAVEHEYVIKDYESLRRNKKNVNADNTIIHIACYTKKMYAMRYWYNVKLPSILKKLHADVVVSCFGIVAKTNIPHVVVIPNATYLNEKTGKQTWQKFFVKQFEKTVSTAPQFLVQSNAAADFLKSKAASITAGVNVLPFSAASIFQPMEWHDKLYIKSRFAYNKEYFVAVMGDDDEKHFVQLLKAFSKFKKWQQSTMNLLLLPKEDRFTQAIYDKLDTYKYKDDIQVINDADEKETAQIIATSYALVHLPVSDVDMLPAVCAIQSSIPVVAYQYESLKEYANGCGLFATEHQPEALGDLLIQIFKDENLRTTLCDACIAQSKLYEQKNVKEVLWQSVVNSK